MQLGEQGHSVTRGLDQCPIQSGKGDTHSEHLEPGFSLGLVEMSEPDSESEQSSRVASAIESRWHFKRYPREGAHDDISHGTEILEVSICASL